jgi:SAM-dependent methyltransferase
MLIKNLFRILFDYKFSLVTLVFFEFLYFVKGYKGNRFDFSNNKWMSDNIPCPYYFLFKMKKTLKRENFLNFIDLGCGSGRVINFFNKNFPNKKFIGIEYFATQYNYCKKIFKNQSNVEIIQADFAKSDFYKHKADCYFFNDPFTNSVDFIKFIENIIKSSDKKKILFIFVNYNKKVIDELKNMQCIDSFYISNIKGYSICSLDNN